ncbi:hypothetical protein [Bradyrhizobium sediminis]|uniref:hypothetical protein n=1 Tax=Bradyrhizobium sediminis TaxID=2840469 RepID=UPI00201C02DC|nr:hypothetical protein [Bradyrhizobium sediminis]
METRKSSDKGLIDGYREKLKAGNVSEKIASETASAEIAAQVSETYAILQYRIAEIGRWYEPDKLMGYFVAICMGQGVGAWNDRSAGGTQIDRIQSGVVLFRQAGFENVAMIIKR